jgi:tetratricopeptide (TPR) repeat protein
MITRIMLSAAAVATMLAATTAAQAQSAVDRERCDNIGREFSFETMLAACTRRIQSGQLTQRDLAISYNNRGSAMGNMRDYDRAIADYSEAIRLNPNYALAYKNRGNAWHFKRDYDRAVADYNQAIRIDPNYALAYHSRGLARQATGDKAGGEADIAMARKLKPGIGQ